MNEMESNLNSMVRVGCVALGKGLVTVTGSREGSEVTLVSRKSVVEVPTSLFSGVEFLGL